MTAHPFAIVAALAIVVITAHPARADRCDDLAAQIARNIDGAKVGKTVAGIVYLIHPAVKQASLGCSARNKENEIFAASPTRKPSKEFFDFVAGAGALVFTITKDDVLRGVKRCAGRIGFFRGKNIVTRYRRLDIRCTGERDSTTITVSREIDNSKK